MKKIRIVAALMALLLCVSMLLVACDSKEEEIPTYGITDIMNADNDADDKGVITSYKDVSYVGDYNKGAYGIVVTTDASGESLVTRIYDASTDQVVLTLTNSKSVDQTVTPAVTTYKKNYVNIISDGYFAVLTTSAKQETLSGVDTYSTYFGCALYGFDTVEYTLTIYDVKGSAVDTYVNDELISLCNNNAANFDKVYGGESYTSSLDTDSLIYEYLSIDRYLLNSSLNLDIFVVGTKVYRYGKDLKATLVKDYGISNMPNFSSFTKHGDYYVGSASNIYTVYDKNLDKVYSYQAPGYAMSRSFDLLANGNAIAQYLIQLDQNEKTFDIRNDADGKYDLVTVLVTKDSVTELTDVNYMFGDFKANLPDVNGNKLYSDKVDNLAFIYPIADNKMMDSSYANKQLVVISNEGKIVANVDIKGDLAGMPQTFMKDYYAVKLADNSNDIYDAQGKVVNNVTSSLTSMGSFIGNKYFFTDKAIYSVDGEKVYDAEKDHASLLICGDSVIIKVVGLASTKYSLFANGTTTVIGTVALKDGTIDGFKYNAQGYYSTFNKETNKYTYYNENGAVIGTFDKELTYIVAGDDFVILRDAANKIFYKFSFSK